MKSKQLESSSVYKDAFYIQKIGNRAVKSVLERNQKKNIASVFSKEGKIFYKLPSGEITEKSPFKN
ncbi:hypothetical protein PQO03_17800 [Lentisphaera profundi]|uniref:Uncharacterized protein n=1 Tax=Lentisphaera profundi TaxID=1658616 RepID=A0ABY7VUE2_9BACT|nr:hypothetical protein [Lentisphaera profundi]WDE97682.1 hypothetical protein PQO03_17800 [Lentisphaera profundi]